MKSTIAVFGIHFSTQDAEALVDLLTLEPLIANDEARMLFTANLDHVVKMRKNADFREAYGKAEIVTSDGMPVYLYARWRGIQIPGRVTGSGLFPMLMSKLSPEKHRPFFVVSDHETAARIEIVLAKRGFKDLLTVVPPFGFDTDTDYSAQLARRIAEHGTTHLLFCVGAPKSELWLDRHRKEVGPCYALSLGAGANFFAGTDRRAPVWVQKCGAEWLWRFAREPRRLFRRYFIDSWSFLLAVADDLRHKEFQ
jgi:N-acetylglucosaminyldiphosphoundecaprenol N-acetyl-beta-D-mannosaminyltransferase